MRLPSVGNDISYSVKWAPGVSPLSWLLHLLYIFITSLFSSCPAPTHTHTLTQKKNTHLDTNRLSHTLRTVHTHTNMISNYRRKSIVFSLERSKTPEKLFLRNVPNMRTKKLFDKYPCFQPNSAALNVIINYIIKLSLKRLCPMILLILCFSLIYV